MENFTERNIDINQGWEFGNGLYSPLAAISGAPVRTVNLPHDYMIESDVTPDALAGPASGYFTAATANYNKKIDIPAEWEGEQVGLKFDGVMMNATVEVNGCKVLLQHYGYAPFYADLTPYIYYGKANRVNITVNPSMQPNCRWYSGAGVFRAIQLVHTPALHIANDGIYVYTKDVEYVDGKPAYAYLRAEVEVENNSLKNYLARVNVIVKKEGSEEVAAKGCGLVQVNPGKTMPAKISMILENPELWDAENPNLYIVTASVEAESVYRTHIIPEENKTVDTDSVLFGVRMITADVIHGLRVNGKTVKLKGGCLHHDNGLMGAVSLYDSEERKLRILKEIGYNAVRTTHNPPSSAFMEACDRLGIYVFDEAFDAWGIGKQPGDYNMFFDTDWEKDLTAFVKRDRNHPAVIIWSTGNEITERGGLNNGYTLADQLAQCVKNLDASRPVSNGICSMWSGQDDEIAEAGHKAFAALISGGAASLQNADTGVADTTWEKYTEAFANNLDIVGYNYMEDRYPMDHEMFPDRVILGSENYPKEIGFRWPMVESTPYVIGDFTWTAFDYIGEAGIGKSVFMEKDDPHIKMGPLALMSHGSTYPWRLANDADVDINGNLLTQGAYRKVVWGDQGTYLFSYDPADHEKVEVISQWGFTGAVKSWNWAGQEEKPVSLIAFSRAEEVEVIVNGTSLGRKAVSQDRPLPNSVTFETVYQPGTVVAISYQDGKEVSRTELVTTGEPKSIRLIPEKTEMAAGGLNLIYVGVEVLDEAGHVVPNAAIQMEAAVSGAAELAGFGSGNPITDENYTKGQAASYRGRITAILRSGCQAGEAVLTVKAEGMEEVSLTVTIA